MAPAYAHTQQSPLWLVLATFAAAAAAGAVLTGELGARLAVGALAGVFALLALCFATLTVADRGDHLAVRFGPLPLFGTRVSYAAVRGVARARSRLVDGWGLHWLPGRGWTFNLWGFDCVEVVTAKGIVRIGTDDPDGLAAHLAARTAAAER